MGVNADATGIQFRMLNRAKGPSVRAPRVQCDKKAYQFRMKWLLERQARLDVKQGGVTKILVERGRAVGVQSDFGLSVRAGSVVITAGTFLRGLLHVGDRSQPGGRMADSSSPLSDNLRELGLPRDDLRLGPPVASTLVRSISNRVANNWGRIHHAASAICRRPRNSRRGGLFDPQSGVEREVPCRTIAMLDNRNHSSNT